MVALQNFLSIQPQMPGIGFQESQNVFPPGKEMEVIPLQSFQEREVDTRAPGKFLQGNAPGFPLPP
jgi:hypothetical protein